MVRFIAVLTVLALTTGGCGENTETAGVDPSSAPTTAIETSPDQTPTTEPAELESTASSESTDELEPMTLTAAQLDELWPSPELVGSLIGAAKVDEVPNSYGPPVDLPPTATSVGRDYWSLDTGKRSVGVEPVDLISVQLVLLENDADVLPVFEAVIAFDAVYWAWIPIDLPGAVEALKSEWIPYEGEPDDEPEFGSVLARRDLLIVVVTAAGSDAAAVSPAATAIAGDVFDRVGEISKR